MCQVPPNNDAKGGRTDCTLAPSFDRMRLLPRQSPCAGRPMNRPFRGLQALVLTVAVETACGHPLPTPPAPSKTAASTGAHSFTEAVPCTACHTTAGWRVRNDGDKGGFDHAATGFPLTGAHLQGACTSCHRTSQGVHRACVSCHEDQHRGQLSSSCDTCHSAVGWRVTRPLEIHRFTRFPLTGMHALADCTQCHQRAADNQWFGAPVQCFACHEREYRRADLRPVHQGSASRPPFSRDCAQCHRPLAWAPAMFDPTQVAVAALEAAPAGHDLRFPISFGMHRVATCSDCHTSLAVPRAVRCIGCHAHEPVRLAAQHRAPIGTDGPSCLACHVGGARR